MGLSPPPTERASERATHLDGLSRKTRKPHFLVTSAAKGFRRTGTAKERPVGWVKMWKFQKSRLACFLVPYSKEPVSFQMLAFFPCKRNLLILKNMTLSLVGAIHFFKFLINMAHPREHYWKREEICQKGDISARPMLLAGWLAWQKVAKCERKKCARRAPNFNIGNSLQFHSGEKRPTFKWNFRFVLVFCEAVQASSHAGYYYLVTFFAVCSPLFFWPTFPWLAFLFLLFSPRKRMCEVIKKVASVLSWKGLHFCQLCQFQVGLFMTSLVFLAFFLILIFSRFLHDILHVKLEI